MKVRALSLSMDLGFYPVVLQHAAHTVAAPGGFLGFLETGQPSYQARHVTSNAVRGRHDHSYKQGNLVLPLSYFACAY